MSPKNSKIDAERTNSGNKRILAIGLDVDSYEKFRVIKFFAKTIKHPLTVSEIFSEMIELFLNTHPDIKKLVSIYEDTQDGDE